MIAVLVLVGLVALFGICLPNLLRPMPPGHEDDPSGGAPAEPPPERDQAAFRQEPTETGYEHGAYEHTAAHPESMTAELDPCDEEYLAFLADELWPDDEYLELEHSTDGEEESGGSGMLL